MISLSCTVFASLATLSSAAFWPVNSDGIQFFHYFQEVQFEVPYRLSTSTLRTYGQTGKSSI